MNVTEMFNLFPHCITHYFYLLSGSMKHVLLKYLSDILKKITYCMHYFDYQPFTHKSTFY